MDNKKVSWNASQGLISEISNRRSYANSFFVNGDVKKAFKTLISIKQSVIQSFNKDEREELNKKELKFSKYSRYLLTSYANSWNKESKKVYNLSRGLSEDIYSEYNDYLMDLLDKYGYLIGVASDSSRMTF